MASNIVNVGYGSTNYYVIAAGPVPRLLVDCGWPGTMGKLKNRLERKGVDFRKLGHLLVTHYHPDHAGLAQELKNAGLKLLVMETQAPFIAGLKKIMKPDSGYVEIAAEGNVVLKAEESRPFLKRLGIEGQILPTPGHSPDSVSLVLDEGIVFTGDLPPETMISPDDTACLDSWKRITEIGTRIVYPAHGRPRRRGR